jgi:hypothetical protein
LTVINLEGLCSVLLDSTVTEVIREWNRACQHLTDALTASEYRLQVDPVQLFSQFTTTFALRAEMKVPELRDKS